MAESRIVVETRVLLRSEASDGIVSVVENTVPAHWEGTPLHHHAFDEAFYVLDGELTFLLDDGDVSAPTGTFVLVPPGVKHTFRNALDRETRVLNIHTPAGFDRRMLG